MPVGRKPTKNYNLPQGVRAREQKSGKVYYYFEISRKPHKELPLGSDYALAMKKWAELAMQPMPQNVSQPTLRNAIDLYFESEDFKEKAVRTQKDYRRYAMQVLKFFDDPPAPLDSIVPGHIRQYLKWRKDAPINANREKAFISLVFNFARGEELTDRPNPCAGIVGYSESGRDIYVEDRIMQAVYDEANEPLKDAIDIAYLCGQRPADTLKMSETDLRDGEIWVRQNKTAKPLRVVVEGMLKEVIDRISERKKGYKVRSLALIISDRGRKVSYEMLNDYFVAARKRAAEKNPSISEEILAFQFRDLRAKAGTDKADSVDMQEAQKLLGHSTITMTQHYVRRRAGDKVKPTK